LNIGLSKLYDKIRTQEGLLETIQHERDLSCRQLEVAVADNSVLIEDNRTLRISIRSLKDENRDKDRLCLETHVRPRQLAVDFADLQKEIEQNLHNADEMLTEYRNKIQRSMHLVKLTST
jgi:predicted RNA-binding protein with RPS1 domain